MAMLGGECSPCCEGGECFARTCRCLSVESLSGGITVSFDSNLPSVCGGPHDSISFQASDFELRDRDISRGCVLDAGEIVSFPDCNFNDGYRCSLSLQQTGQSGSRGDLVVVVRQIVDSESFFRTWAQFDLILQEEITLSSVSHRIAGQVTIENYCNKTNPTQLTIPLRNVNPDDPAQYSGTATLTVPPPVEDNPCTVCNRGQFGDLVKVPRYHRIGNCGSDCPDTSGACCETDGTCNIKPQCECDTDNGAVFAGVGEGCEACTPECLAPFLECGPTAIRFNISIGESRGSPWVSSDFPAEISQPPYSGIPTWGKLDEIVFESIEHTLDVPITKRSETRENYTLNSAGDILQLYRTPCVYAITISQRRRTTTNQDDYLFAFETRMMSFSVSFGVSSFGYNVEKNWYGMAHYRTPGSAFDESRTYPRSRNYIAAYAVNPQYSCDVIYTTEAIPDGGQVQFDVTSNTNTESKSVTCSDIFRSISRYSPLSAEQPPIEVGGGYSGMVGPIPGCTIPFYGDQRRVADTSVMNATAQLVYGNPLP